MASDHKAKFEEFLRDVKCRDGEPMLKHLGLVVEKMLVDHQASPLAVFEEVSGKAAEDRLHAKEKQPAANSKPPGESDDLRYIHDHPEETKAFVKKAAEHLDFVKRETEGDDQGEPADPAPIGYVPDLVADDLLFRKAGFGIGEKESYLVYAALKKFVAARSAPFAKFWGKVFGRLRDYYVIETDVEVEQPEEILESHEPRKEGANKKIYFVTHDILDPSGWQELPVVLPRHIVQARRIRYTFTGDLEAPINTSPVFQGKEKHFLKAQIVRMDHSCDLVPSYLYKLNPADETDPNPQEIEKLEGEDLKPLPVEEMARLGSWVHFAPTLLKEGRVKRKELEEEDETKKEQLEKERSLEDPLEARLKPISRDQMAGLPACWALRVHGDLGKRQHAYKPSKTDPTVVSLRSLVWPGFVHFVSQTMQVKSVYIGDGNKFACEDYFPRFPYLIEAEPADPAEFPDPFGEEPRRPESRGRPTSGPDGDPNLDGVPRDNRKAN